MQALMLLSVQHNIRNLSLFVLWAYRLANSLAVMSSVKLVLKLFVGTIIFCPFPFPFPFDPLAAIPRLMPECGVSAIRAKSARERGWDLGRPDGRCGYDEVGLIPEDVEWEEEGMEGVRGVRGVRPLGRTARCGGTGANVWEWEWDWEWETEERPGSEVKRESVGRGRREGDAELRSGEL